MTITLQKSQRGAVLLVSLIILLVITLLAVSNMRGITLESRITANRAHETQAISVADAALREAEFRFYGPGSLVDKLEPSAKNCAEANKLVDTGNNKPCLLNVKNAKLITFVNSPYVLTSANKAALLESDSIDGLAWMPYRGLDAETTTVASSIYDVKWNSIRATEAAVNAEYGMIAEGQGTYFYLNNSKAGENLYLQSTHANIYLGLNN